MRKTLPTIVSTAVLALGLVWQYQLKIVAILGWALDLLQLKDLSKALIDLVERHPDLLNAIGPSVLMVAGLLSLALIHAWPKVQEIIKTAPLEIVYDPMDPQGKYGGFDIWGSSEGPVSGYAIRIGVKNNTQKTIRRITGTVEGSVADLFIPSTLKFTRTKKFSDDVFRKSEELLDVFLLVGPPEEWKLPSGEHEVTIRIRSEDADEIVEKFYLSKDRLPPFYRQSTQLQESKPAT